MIFGTYSEAMFRLDVRIDIERNVIIAYKYTWSKDHERFLQEFVSHGILRFCQRSTTAQSLSLDLSIFISFFHSLFFSSASKCLPLSLSNTFYWVQASYRHWLSLLRLLTQTESQSPLTWSLSYPRSSNTDLWTMPPSNACNTPSPRPRAQSRRRNLGESRDRMRRAQSRVRLPL